MIFEHIKHTYCPDYKRFVDGRICKACNDDNFLKIHSSKCLDDYYNYMDVFKYFVGSTGSITSKLVGLALFDIQNSVRARRFRLYDRYVLDTNQSIVLATEEDVKKIEWLIGSVIFLYDKWLRLFNAFIEDIYGVVDLRQINKLRDMLVNQNTYIIGEEYISMVFSRKRD